jgi:hypothetical protein
LYSQITITPQITPTPEQASTLTPDQQQQFDSQKLTVTGFGMTLASTRWVVTQGYNKLNEPDFLRILGLDKESLNSQSHQTGVAVLTWGGAGLGVVGLAVVLISTLSFATNPNIANGTSMPNIGAFTAKIGGGTLGIVGGTIMMGIGMTQSPNITPYGQAEAWAEKYNAQLVIKIAGKS